MAYETKDQARHAAYDAASADKHPGGGDAQTNHTLNYIMGRTDVRP